MDCGTHSSAIGIKNNFSQFSAGASTLMIPAFPQNIRHSAMSGVHSSDERDLAGLTAPGPHPKHTTFGKWGYSKPFVWSHRRVVFGLETGGFLFWRVTSFTK